MYLKGIKMTKKPNWNLLRKVDSMSPERYKREGQEMSTKCNRVQKKKLKKLT
jgi:hypothetical protein